MGVAGAALGVAGAVGAVGAAAVLVRLEVEKEGGPRGGVLLGQARDPANRDRGAILTWRLRLLTRPSRSIQVVLQQADFGSIADPTVGDITPKAGLQNISSALTLTDLFWFITQE